MSGALRACWIACLLAASAHAESPPVVVEPFSHRCFDAAALADRIRMQLPEATVSVGAAPSGPHSLVQVRREPPNLVVRISLRGVDRRVMGSAERLLSDDDDCATLLETAALIVVRAATPLAFRAPPSSNPPNPPRHLRPPERKTPPVVSENRTPPQVVSDGRTAPTVVSENRTPPPSPSPIASVSRTTPPAVTHPASDHRTASKPQRHHRLELDVAARWSFPLDGPPSTPGGEVTLGWRWLRGRLGVGLGLRAGVSEEWTASTRSPSGGVVTVSARRIPVGAELRLDFDVPRARGVIRLSAGPEVAIWAAESSGLPRPGSAVFVQAGAFARAAYRLELGRATLTAGLDLEVAFQQDHLKVGGVGQVSQTQVVQLSPFIGAGVGFF